MVPLSQLQKFERSAWESAKYGKNPFRTVGAVERIWEDVPYYSSFIANSWLNDLKDTGQGQKSSHATHTLILVIVLSNTERIHPSCRTRQDVTHLEFVLLSRGYMTLKIQVKVTGHYAWHTLLTFLEMLETISRNLYPIITINKSIAGDH